MQISDLKRIAAKAIKLDAKLATLICAGFLAAVVVPNAHASDIRSSFAPDAKGVDIFKFGFKAYKQGEAKVAVEALEYAAEKGHPASQWKLGRMYQTGDGVEADPRKAFELFADIANKHANVRPGSNTARFVANSFVALGQYFENGSDAAGIAPNRTQAMRYYEHAAFYFGDPDAQFELARFHLETDQPSRKAVRHAMRGLLAAAKRGHPKSAAKLGQLLMEGQFVKQDLVQGLKFLTIAMKNAGPALQNEIRPLQERALSMANEDQRRQAIALAGVN